MALQTRPEPMNASPHHSKVKVSLTLANPIFVAGEFVSGKMEMECRAERGLGIGVMMVELVAIQELTSRDHSATSTFLHSRRLFQGPGLPPSNAVQPYPLPGDPTLPRDYHQARRGLSTFLFRFPIPSSSPSSLSFGGGLARVKYEVRASVGVAWKGEKRLVTDKREIDVVESFEEDFSRVEPEGVVVGENGKIWAHGRIVGGAAVAGESTCVELQVKNHSSKKNLGLSISLTRVLHFPDLPSTQQPPLQISDTLTTVAFRGPEYIIAPGGEGVASLVFDVPKNARGVKGGTREADEGDVPNSEPLFEVRCIVGVKILMGLGSKDLVLNLPVTIVHPEAMPKLPPPPSSPYPFTSTSTPPELAVPPQPPMSPMPYLDLAQAPYIHPAAIMSPPYMDQGQIWFPPPSQSPNPYQYISPPIHGQQYYFPQPMPLPPFSSPPRPTSANAYASVPADVYAQPHTPPDAGVQLSGEPEEGKGERASRIAQTLHYSSRNRSVSPQSHRFPLPVAQSPPTAVSVHSRLQNLPPASDAVSIPAAKGVVHSPRPFLSPKQSVASFHNSLPKSERVEELERMAEEVTAQSEDLSGDIPKTLNEPSSYSDKTLPVPPVPSEKGKLLSPLSAARPPIDSIFAIAEAADAAPSDKTPPTPTLTAVTPLKQLPRAVPDLGGSNGLGRSESGLDALERRLLAEVGTRKLDLERRPDVRTVLPITIPQPNADVEPLHDSAISSLTLADHDSDEQRTHKAGKSSMSGDDRDAREGSGKKGRERKKKRGDDVLAGGSQEAVVVVERDEERRKGKKKERGRDGGDAHKFRKGAKGRVAAWLGGIDPDVPPPEAPPIPGTSNLVAGGISTTPTSPVSPPALEIDFEPPKVFTWTPRPKEDADGDVSSAPNPRSSGFVPIGTLKKDTFKRHPALRGDPPDDKRHADVAASPQTKRAPPSLPSPAVQHTLVPKTTTHHDLPKAKAKAKLANGHLHPIPQRAHSTPDSPVPKAGAKASPRLPVFPPPQPPRLNPEAKYDIKSARGGRGGQVTAVASIWSSGTTQQASKPGHDAKPKGAEKSSPFLDPAAAAAKPPRAVGKSPLSITSTPTAPSLAPEAPKLVDLAGKRSRPVVKSTSVPAIISSSHATPTLSSTASLARVTTTAKTSVAAGARGNSPVVVKTLPPTISELPSDAMRPNVSSAKGVVSKTPAGDLAFGKARLRDLIKKYQEQAT